MRPTSSRRPNRNMLHCRSTRFRGSANVLRFPARRSSSAVSRARASSGEIASPDRSDPYGHAIVARTRSRSTAPRNSGPPARESLFASGIPSLWRRRAHRQDGFFMRPRGPAARSWSGAARGAEARAGRAKTAGFTIPSATRGRRSRLVRRSRPGRLRVPCGPANRSLSSAASSCHGWRMHQS